MDLHALPRRDLQALAKRNGVRANMSNAAMADALAALPAVDGIEEYVQQPVAEPTPAAEPEVQPEEEEEKQAPAEEEEEPEKQEVIVLDDSEEEEKDLNADQDQEKAPAVGRRRATRRTRAEPVAAPATRRRAAASKADEADAAAEAVPARATRGQSQRTVVEDEAPKARRTSRKAVAKKAGTEQEDEEKGTQGDVSSDEGGDAAQNAEQNAPAEEQSQEDESETVKEDAAAEAVPARTTRGRSQRTAAADEAPKARRTSRRAGARKTGTEQEEEEKGTQGDVSDMEATMAAPVSSDDGGHGAAQNEQQNAPLEEQSQEYDGEMEKQDAAAQAVPARATRARRQRTVESAAEEEAPRARRTSRRAVSRKTAAGQEEQDEPVEEQSQEGEGVTEKVDTAAAAVPARATRARSQKKVVWADQLPKTKRTSTRDAASKTSTEQEEAHGDVSDVEAAVPSDEGGHAAEEMEAAMDAQDEEQFAAAEAVPARTTRARRQRTVVPAAEEVAPKARRTSRRAAARKTSTEQEEGEKATQGDVADGEATVPASDEEADGSEEMEVAIEAQNEEQNELVEEQRQEEEGETGVVDITAPVDEEPPEAEDCVVDSSVEEQQCEDSPVVLAVAEQEASHAFQNDAVSSEGIHHASEDEEMVPVDEVLQTPLNVSHATKENEVPTAEEVVQSADKAIDEQEDKAAGVVTNNTDVFVEDMASDASEEDEDCTAEDVDSSKQEPLVHVQQCEKIHFAGEDTEMVPVNELQQVMLEAGEENEDCTVEEEPPLADDVDSSVQEPLVDLQECEATKEIHFASEDAEMMPINDVSEAIEDVASDVSEENEDCTVEEPPVADVDDVSVQEPLVDVQQCEAAEEIHLATEDTEMVPVLESGEVTEEDFNSYASEQTEAPTSAEMLQNAAKLVEENEVPTSCEVLQSSAKAVEENEDMDADEVPHNTEDYVDTDEYVEEEAVVATEMPQISEAMDQGVVEVVAVENLSQGTITDDEGAVKESGFSCDLADVSVEEKEVVAAEGMPQSSATMEENVEEVFTVDNLSQATVTDDEGAVKESGFTGELMDVPVEEVEVVAAAEIPHSSAKMDEDVQEEVVTVNNLSQDTGADEEGAVKESVFSCGLSVLSVDEEGVMPADQMQLSSATMNMSVEEVVTVDNLSQATVTDDEWAVKESAFTGECTPVVEAARDFSDHIASPFSANVFEYATKSLSMDSITVETTASEPADVPLCMYSNSGGKKDASELGAVQRENEVKEGNKPEAAFGRIIHSPLTIRKLRMAVAQENEADDVPPVTIRKVRMAVAQENEADDVPLCIFGSSSCKKNASEPVAVQPENEVKEGSEPEAAFGRIIHSPLTIRKLRMAVAQEIEADDVPPLTIRKLRMEVAQENAADGVPLCIFSSSCDEENASEHVAVQRENEVKEEKEPEAEFGRIIHSPLTIRRLRMAVAQEIEADDVPPLTVRKLRMEVARENAADEVPLCIFSSSGGDENSAEPMLVGSLSRRKLRANLNEKVAVAQENEVKEGEKSSAPLDKLSLRKLRLKLKETLTAQKNVEPKRVALGRLDENAC